MGETQTPLILELYHLLCNKSPSALKNSPAPKLKLFLCDQQQHLSWCYEQDENGGKIN